MPFEPWRQHSDMTRFAELLQHAYNMHPQHEIDRLMATYGPGLTFMEELDDDGMIVIKWGEEIFTTIDPRLLVSGAERPN
jgi:hypothetical protein